MHPPVSAEQWAALRALRMGEAPTFPRLSAASGLHVTTIRERASRDDWPKMRYPRSGSILTFRGLSPVGGAAGRVGEDVADSVGGGTDEAGGADGGRAGTAAVAGPAGADPEAAVDAGTDEAAHDAVGMDARVQTGAGMTRQEVFSVMARQVEAVLLEAEQGRIDKGRIDAVLSMMRLTGFDPNTPPPTAATTKTRSDDHLAETLRRIDERIVELAFGLAARLGVDLRRP